MTLYALMDSPSVDRAFTLAPGIAYIRVTSFDQGTGKLVKETIEKLGGEKHRDNKPEDESRKPPTGRFTGHVVCSCPYCCGA